MLPTCVLVHTAPEMYIKSGFVSRQMTSLLSSNIQKALKNQGVSFADFQLGKGWIRIGGRDLEKIAAGLKWTFGIHMVALTEWVPKTDLDLIVEKTVDWAKKELKKGDSFAVDCSRSGIHSFSSRDVEVKAGAAILQAISGLKVSLKQPAKTIFVNVLSNGFLVFSRLQLGVDGFPVGSQGTIGFFVEGKKEEETALWLLLKRGCFVCPIVKKKDYPAFLKKLEPWNSFEPFEVLLESEAKAAVKKKKLLALATADHVLSEKELQKMIQFDARVSLPVLRPLLGFPLDSSRVPL